ncbi:MAG: hypothetical protein SVZ03_00105 [Spirochaetota bacterium]|nr:hypothetical protein [Spirochaetota bacterium]
MRSLISIIIVTFLSFKIILSDIFGNVTTINQDLDNLEKSQNIIEDPSFNECPCFIQSLLKSESSIFVQETNVDLSRDYELDNIRPPLKWNRIGYEFIAGLGGHTLGMTLFIGLAYYECKKIPMHNVF